MVILPYLCFSRKASHCRSKDSRGSNGWGQGALQVEQAPQHCRLGHLPCSNAEPDKYPHSLTHLSSLSLSLSFPFSVSSCNEIKARNAFAESCKATRLRDGVRMFPPPISNWALWNSIRSSGSRPRSQPYDRVVAHVNNKGTDTRSCREHHGKEKG